MKSLQLPVTNAKGLHASDELLDAPIKLLMSALPSQVAENSKASASERVSSSIPQGDRGGPLSMRVPQSPWVPSNICGCSAQPPTAPARFPAHWPKRKSAGRAPRIAASCLNLSICSSCMSDGNLTVLQQGRCSDIAHLSTPRI